MTEKWKLDNWKEKKIRHQPVYEDEAHLKRTMRTLKKSMPLVSLGEINRMKQQIAKVQKGNAIILQGGDCAESFDAFSSDYVKSMMTILTQMSLIMTYSTGKPVLKIGRMAGQFCKPRSNPNETIDGLTLPVYMGDMINRIEFNEKARKPNPDLMLQGYSQSVQTINLMRAFLSGGFTKIPAIAQADSEFISSKQRVHYERIIDGINRSINFIDAFDVSGHFRERTDRIYVSHEALLLPYEGAMTRQDKDSGQWVNTSAHMIWIGERTRSLDEAHLEYARGVANPIGIKVSGTMKPAELIKLLDILNPENEEGKIILITRFGADNVEEGLKPLLRRVQKEGRHVAWICDAMHGNTIVSGNGYKTRRFATITKEIEGFFKAHADVGTYPGGIHLEMTGQDVTECLGGGIRSIKEADLCDRYHTHCDPRLNRTQAMDVSFLASKIYEELITGYKPESITEKETDHEDD